MNFQEGAFWFLLVTISMLIGAIPKQRKYYKSLKKPKWFPRPVVFAVVWFILYALMATAAVLYQHDLSVDHWKSGETAFIVFWAISTMFSPVFFVMKDIPLSLLICLASFGTSIWVVVEFWKQTTLAGALFLPTTLWTFFASIMSFIIWRFNRSPSSSSTKKEGRFDSRKSSELILE